MFEAANASWSANFCLSQSEAENFTYDCAFGFGLLFATPLLEFHGAKVHDTGSDLVNVVLLCLTETEDVEGFLLGASANSMRASKCLWVFGALKTGGVKSHTNGPNPLSTRKRCCWWPESTAKRKENK